MAAFLGVRPDEVCFTRNATEGNSIIAAGLALQPGDEVIFETHAHPGGSFPWVNQATRRGVHGEAVRARPASPKANLARIRELITPRTKVIQVSHITCTTGLVFPVTAIADLARSRGIWFHIDGAQSVGMIPVNLDAIGCDSYAFSGHKWLGGPHETGVLYIRRDRLEAVAPTGIGAYSGELRTCRARSNISAPPPGTNTAPATPASSPASPRRSACRSTSAATASPRTAASWPHLLHDGTVRRRRHHGADPPPGGAARFHDHHPHARAGAGPSSSAICGRSTACAAAR
jgi:hypothetical protein